MDIDSIVNAHWNKVLAEREAAEEAYERAFEAFVEENGPLYRFEDYVWEPDEEDEQYAIDHFGKTCRELSPEQMEEILRRFYEPNADVFRNIHVQEDCMIYYEIGYETDREDGETLDGQRFEFE